MKKVRVLSSVGIAVAVFALLGCAIIISPGISVEPEAFGKNKKYAVVTIASTKNLHAQKGILQMFKGDIPEQNTQPILDELRPEVIKALKRSKHLKLMPENKVLMSRAYEKLEADEPVSKVLFMKTELNTASGYKFISDPEKFAALVRDLDTDGVMMVSMNFSVSSGVAGGLGIGVKRFKVVSGVSGVAYDREGKITWKDAVHISSDLADSQLAVVADVRSVNFKKLHPYACKAAREGLKVLVARFDDSIEGKPVGAHVETVTP